MTTRVTPIPARTLDEVQFSVPHAAWDRVSLIELRRRADARVVDATTLRYANLSSRAGFELVVCSHDAAHIFAELFDELARSATASGDRHLAAECTQASRSALWAARRNRNNVAVTEEQARPSEQTG